jgi:hypothetical protein
MKTGTFRRVVNAERACVPVLRYHEVELVRCVALPAPRADRFTDEGHERSSGLHAHAKTDASTGPMTHPYRVFERAGSSAS